MHGGKKERKAHNPPKAPLPVPLRPIHRHKSPSGCLSRSRPVNKHGTGAGRLDAAHLPDSLRHQPHGLPHLFLRGGKRQGKRREERTSPSDSPMAASTWDGMGCTVWQADPAEHSSPAGSSKSIRASAVHPEKARLDVFGILSAAPECTVTPSTACARENSKLSRRRLTRPASSTCRRATRAAAPKPMIPGTFSVPDLSPYSWPPPNKAGSRGTPERLYRHPIPFGPCNLWAETDA